MKIQRHLEVTPQEFFDVLSFSITHDIKENGKLGEIKKGFCYTKKISNGITADIEILNYKYPTLYEVKISTYMGSNIIKYEIKDKEIIYTECYYPKNLLYKLNYFLTYLFLYLRNKKNINMQITQMQEYIKQNRI
ncbi:DUF3284 domain-containing protein [Caviibacter abscessus]|uniref:DUF3284 domain-containing protein n=1 Tax=Caviibacter abscessus TaxID=1766719 RepID=UPI00082B1ACB|nr:DUF3284 domain-containing protein [Caviibacter abscessus]